MSKLSTEHTAYAVTVFEKLFKERRLSQTFLEDRAHIAQSEISRILSRQKDPTKKELEHLFEGLGIALSEIISTIEALPENLLVYVGTPLTTFTKDARKDAALRELVTRLAALAKNQQFDKPEFKFYWPGDHTHPVRHAHVPANQVYITDRSLSSSFDLLLMLCLAPSFGMGQENEIATQAGLPAIRLVPEDISRMMKGSFLKSWDIPYTGSVETGIEFDESAFVKALVDARRLYFVHQALFRGIATFSFGERLQRLVDDRIGSHARFAEQLGIEADYLEAMFREPVVVSNPSAILLLRIAKLLDVSVAHLLYEQGVDDAVFVASVASWKTWVSKTDGLDAKTAWAIRENWAEEYQLHRYSTSGSDQNGHTVLTKEDWNKLYTKCHSTKADANQIKREISRHLFKETRVSIGDSKKPSSIESSRRKINKKATV